MRFDNCSFSGGEMCFLSTKFQCLIAHGKRLRKPAGEELGLIFSLMIKEQHHQDTTVHMQYFPSVI